MKLHDPRTERTLLELAAKGRGGTKAQARDPRRWTTGVSISLLIFSYLLAASLGVFETRARTEHWQILISSVVLMWVIQLGAYGLVAAAVGPENRLTLINLPISGEQVFRWSRHRFLVGKWVTLGIPCGIIAFALQGFTLDAPWHWAASFLLLSGTTFGAMMMLHEWQSTRPRWARLWSHTALLLTGMILISFFARRSIFLEGRAPAWLEEGILALTWLLPPSWSMPGRLEHGGIFLTIPWLVVGFSRWRSWPRRMAPYFDAPQDVAHDSPDFEEDDEMEHPVSENTACALFMGDDDADAESDAAPMPPSQSIRLANPLRMPHAGWVERWVRWWVGKQDEHLAAALVSLQPFWTKKTNCVLCLSPVWLMMIWGFAKFYPAVESRESVTGWIWLISSVLLVVCLMPVSNGIPRAMAKEWAGMLGFPFFAALPVGVRDLLRISFRISVARALILAAIATAFNCIQMAILSPEDNPWIAVWVVPAICTFWVFSRPLFVWYRLQSCTRLRRGLLWTHVAATFPSLVLGMVWLVSGVAGIFGGLAVILGSDGERVMSLWLASGGLVVSALSARAIFEIYHWRLRRRHFDWLA